MQEHHAVEVAKRREYKIEPIEKANPTCRDLYPDALLVDGFEP
jgi:hypothetical protein